MKKQILFVIMLAAAQLPAPFTPAAALENETPNGGRGLAGENKAMDKRLTLRMKDRPLADMLDFLSRETGAVFSAGESLLEETRVTVFLRNARLGDILEFLTKAKDLDVRRVGASDVFRISWSTTPFAGFPPLTRKDIEDPVLQRVAERVRLKEAPLMRFLDIVSAQAGVNFIITGDITSIPITVELTKTTVADVLLFLKTKGMSYSQVGNSRTFVVRPGGTDSDKLVQAEQAFKDMKYERSIDLYKNLAETLPDSEIADYALLKAAINYDWLAARDSSPSALREEETFLNRLIANYPKSSRLGDAYLYLGQMYSGYGGAREGAIDCKKAIKFYELAIKNSYRDWVQAQARARTAQCHERGGEKEKAAALYREIVEKYPETAVAKELRGLVNGPDTQQEAGTGPERGSGRIGDTLLEAGIALESQAEYKLAIEVYKKLVAKNTPAVSVHKAEIHIGICQAAMNEPEKAIKTFEAYTARYNPGPEVYLQIGQTLEKAGRPEAARKYLEKAKPAVKP